MSAPNRTPSSTAIDLALITLAAGEILLRHYEQEDCQARPKEDHSPVTDADEEAEASILAALHRKFPGVPVIAEEEVAHGRVHEIAGHFFLVDPLDGTKEFLNRNGEFTVNVGEIVEGRPVRGAILAPAKRRLFLGEESTGAFEIEIAGDMAADFEAARQIRARKIPADGMVAVASRSHRDSKTETYLATYPVKEFISAGSSLKFCLVAAGEADIYPRLGRTMEWDTAAGHAVLSAAGGSVKTIDGKPFVYGKAGEKFANPFFVARGAL